MRIFFTVLLFFLIVQVYGRQRWMKKHRKNGRNGYTKDQILTARNYKHGKKNRFDELDALPYSSPLSRPYNFNMYIDGPYGWGPARRRRNINSYQTGSHPIQNSQQFNNLPALPAVYHQRQPYNYQNFQSRNKINHPSQLSVKQLLPEAPKVQQPAERTWVDKMGVTWTTRKVNDYKWGEREPGIMMDEYAGGPFGFDDVKRDNIERLTANER